MISQHIQSQDFMIPSDTPDIRLHVRHKRLAGLTQFSEDKTVVMMHGATYSSESLYDTVIDGYSFMDYLAGQGYDVYAVDVRGYGRSTRPAEMAQPVDSNPPLVRTDVAVRDFGAAMNFVLRTTGHRHANVIGMSWGGSVTGSYTARNQQKVRKLGLIAPQWLSAKPIPLDGGGPLGAYRIVTVSAARERWISAAPAHKRDTLIGTGGFEAWVDATIGAEPSETLRNDKALQVTNGAIQDIREYWSAGIPFYKPEEIEVPVMLIHGEWDIDVPIESALQYFTRLTAAAYKRWVEIGEATHMVVLEKNRKQVFDALDGFFKEESIFN